MKVLIALVLAPAMSLAISGPVSADHTTGVYGWAHAGKKAAKPAADTSAKAPATAAKADVKPAPALQSVLLTGTGSTHGKNIHFPVAKHQLSQGDAAYVADLAKALKKSEGLYSSVVITGHADISGSAEKNAQLSQERAEAVRAALIAAGNLDASKIKAVGSGATASSTIQASDRRVDIQVEGVSDSATLNNNLR